jgi:hypothetical protein
MVHASIKSSATAAVTALYHKLLPIAHQPASRVVTRSSYTASLPRDEQYAALIRMCPSNAMSPEPPTSTPFSRNNDPRTCSRLSNRPCRRHRYQCSSIRFPPPPKRYRRHLHHWLTPPRQAQACTAYAVRLLMVAKTPGLLDKSWFRLMEQLLPDLMRHCRGSLRPWLQKCSSRNCMRHKPRDAPPLLASFLPPNHRLSIRERNTALVTETNRMHLVLFGMQNRTIGPYWQPFIKCSFQ